MIYLGGKMMEIELDKKYIVVLTEEFARFHDEEYASWYNDPDLPAYIPLIERREQLVVATECASCPPGFDLDFVNRDRIAYAGILGDEYKECIDSIRPDMDQNDIEWW